MLSLRRVFFFFFNYFVFFFFIKSCVFIFLGKLHLHATLRLWRSKKTFPQSFRQAHMKIQLSGPTRAPQKSIHRSERKNKNPGPRPPNPQNNKTKIKTLIQSKVKEPPGGCAAPLRVNTTNRVAVRGSCESKVGP